MNNKFINKLISDTNLNKLDWSKRLEEDTRNFNYSVIICGKLVVLRAIRSSCFFTIESYKLFVPGIISIDAEYSKLDELFDTVKAWEKKIPIEIEKVISNFLST